MVTSRMSSYEAKVAGILAKEHVGFLREKTFADLKHGLYRFDFFLPEKDICIEVQGEQHYHFTKVFHKKREDFLKAQERDRIKISWCLAQNKILYCIPYWEIENLTCVKDLFNPKFLARSKFHNDDVYHAYQKTKAK